MAYMIKRNERGLVWKVHKIAQMQVLEMMIAN